MSRFQQVEGLRLDSEEVAREACEGTVEVCGRMRLDGIAQGRGPAAQVRVEEAALRGEMADRAVVSGDQVAHHLAQAGDVILAFADGRFLLEAERAQAVAHRDQWPLVERSRQVERAVEKDLGPADALEQPVELPPDRVERQTPRGADEVLPGPVSYTHLTL